MRTTVKVCPLKIRGQRERGLRGVLPPLGNADELRGTSQLEVDGLEAGAALLRQPAKRKTSTEQTKLGRSDEVLAGCSAGARYPLAPT